MEYQIVFNAFERVREYHAAAIKLFHDYPALNLSPVSTIQCSGKPLPRWDTNDGFTIVVYKGITVGSSYDSLTKFNIMELLDIVTLLITQIPLEFSCVEHSSRHKIFKIAVEAPYTAITVARDYLKDKIARLGIDEVSNNADLIHELEVMRAKNAALEAQLVAIRAAMGLNK
jgi:hypothetical protein